MTVHLRLQYVCVQSAAGWDHIEKVEKHNSQKGWKMKMVKGLSYSHKVCMKK